MVVHATWLRIVDALLLVGVRRMRCVGMHMRAAVQVQMLVFGLVWMGTTPVRAGRVKG
jgi:hypothetical protein